MVAGAGLSGLTAALDLRDAGWEVVVFEARDRVGGRVHTIHDAFGEGYEVAVHHHPSGRGARPELRQVFWVYRNRAEVFTRLEIADRKEIESNYLAPVVSEQPVTLAHHAPLQALFVPYDNDNYFRYRSDGWGEGDGDGDGSYEVSALYDDAPLTRPASRAATCVASASLTRKRASHDVWVRIQLISTVR